ncbi:MAG: hypothetical protein ABTQ25_18800, partial [Nitrosomonas ureae]
WRTRYHSRNKSAKRRYYRYVANEKKRLINSGVHIEEVRLLCRHLANLRNVCAERRLQAFRDNHSRDL